MKNCDRCEKDDKRCFSQLSRNFCVSVCFGVVFPDVSVYPRSYCRGVQLVDLSTFFFSFYQVFICEKLSRCQHEVAVFTVTGFVHAGHRCPVRVHLCPSTLGSHTSRNGRFRLQSPPPPSPSPLLISIFHPSNSDLARWLLEVRPDDSPHGDHDSRHNAEFHGLRQPLRIGGWRWWGWWRRRWSWGRFRKRRKWWRIEHADANRKHGRRGRVGLRGTSPQSPSPSGEWRWLTTDVAPGHDDVFGQYDGDEQRRQRCWCEQVRVHRVATARGGGVQSDQGGGGGSRVQPAPSPGHPPLQSRWAPTRGRTPQPSPFGRGPRWFRQSTNRARSLPVPADAPEHLHRLPPRIVRSSVSISTQRR